VHELGSAPRMPRPPREEADQCGRPLRRAGGRQPEGSRAWGAVALRGAVAGQSDRVVVAHQRQAAQRALDPKPLRPNVILSAEVKRVQELKREPPPRDRALMQSLIEGALAAGARRVRTCRVLGPCCVGTMERRLAWTMMDQHHGSRTLSTTTPSRA
jgi:hypothetical protein